MKVTLLGTGAPLAPERATLGLWLDAPGCPPLLIDACGGFEIMRQLARFGLDPGKLSDVILSHRHGDHIGGVMALFIARSPLHLHGPQDALDGARELVRLTYPQLALEPGRHLHEHPVLPGRSYAIAGFEITFFEVVHRVPTYALRVRRGDKVLAYSADSLPCDALVACAADADLFLCDALCAASDGAELEQRSHALMHPTAREAAAMAQQAGARALALVHLARYASPAAMLAEARAVFDGPVSVPDDGAVFDL